MKFLFSLLVYTIIMRILFQIIVATLHLNFNGKKKKIVRRVFFYLNIQKDPSAVTVSIKLILLRLGIPTNLFFRLFIVIPPYGKL